VLDVGDQAELPHLRRGVDDAPGLPDAASLVEP
jgi:hypothetical protein